MPTTIRMPQLGETVTEGTVAQWLKKPGDAVEKYEAFVEVSTDKVNAEVPAPVAGIIRELIVAEGETVPTGAAICVIDEVGTDARAAATPPPAVVLAATTAVAHSTNGSTSAAAVNGTRVSPAVRRLAREHAVDLSGLRGTGSHGRITADDVLAAANAGPSSVTAAAILAPPPPSAAPAPPPASVPTAGGRLIPHTPVRKLIAARMVASKQTAPHAWTMTEVDVSAVWAWRLRERGAFEERHAVKLTLLPFFLRAVVEALRAFPLMNATFRDDGILVHDAVHLGVATAAGENLLVPVIRDADRLSISGLARAAGALIEKARSGKLSADELGGGTFTANNTGAVGSILSAPILVPGQAGIVTMEAVVKRPVVRDDDAITIRSMMNVCLSLDHRVVDGAVAAGFLADLKRRLEAMSGGTL